MCAWERGGKRRVLPRRHALCLGVLLLWTLLCAGCGAGESAAPDAAAEVVSSMELRYARCFSVDYLAGGCAQVSIEGGDRFLIVPEGAQEPRELPSDACVLHTPLKNCYLADSSAMDLFLQLDALDRVRFTSTRAEDWSIDAVRDALAEDAILYAGKYSAPDYEALIEEDCGFALENTMIYHSPKTKEQLEALGIPVLVERSSYEDHPLGRMEWVRLYGLLTGKEAEADAFFDRACERVEDILSAERGERSVAVFYLSSGGYVNVRRPGDYVSRMVELAGGRYALGLADSGEDRRSTMNMQTEAFYDQARSADVLIYNAVVDGGVADLSSLLERAGWLKDFQAVKNGEVWCMEQDMYQRTSAVAEVIEDLHTLLTEGADAPEQLTYLHRLR